MIIKSKNVYSTSYENSKINYEKLVIFINDFLNLKKLNITDISKIYVNQGPGSFAGIRNSISVVKAIYVAKKIDLYISSLSKGLGSFGGYVSSQNNVIDACINKSKSFIYTSALPSFLVEHSIKRVQSNRGIQQKKLHNNIEKLSKGLKSIGYEINSKSQIIPIIIGKEKTAMEFGKFLFKNGIFAQPIRYPTVAKNQARLRISVTAWLKKSEIEESLRIFEKGFKKFY